jgi:hypothetical protein
MLALRAQSCDYEVLRTYLHTTSLAFPICEQKTLWTVNTTSDRGQGFFTGIYLSVS